MFTDRAQQIIEAAKDHAHQHKKELLDLESVLAAIASDPEASVRLAECLTSGDADALRAKCPELGRPPRYYEKMSVEDSFKGVLDHAMELAKKHAGADEDTAGSIGIAHLVCALAVSRDACGLLEGVSPISRQDAAEMLNKWISEGVGAQSLSAAVARLQQMRNELQSKIFGQDHAINALVECLYIAEVTAAVDTGRKRPAAVFVFAGPPGVGKTYLAELTATLLERPFRRFDMTGYTDHQSHNELVGYAPVYRDSASGSLTGFVEQHPDSILLVDEIEKAHPNVIQLFYQVLDAGRLEDKHLGRDVAFRDTIIIFTTNAGSSLYDNPNKTGISAANSSYHRRSILSALQSEKNSSTGLPTFPQALCSRIAQGYPILLNHLGANELERVCATELSRTEKLLSNRYSKEFSHDPLLPMLLVAREGARADARQLRSESEVFVKTELFRYCSLYTEQSEERAFEGIDRIHFEVEAEAYRRQPSVRALFELPDKPKVLLVTGPRLAGVYSQSVQQVDWRVASSPEEVITILTTEDVDMVLLDLWLRREDATTDDDKGAAEPWLAGRMDTIRQGFDFVPLAAHALDEGRTILARIHERLPAVPVYLLSLDKPSPELIDYVDDEDRDIAATVRFDATAGPLQGGGLGESLRRPIDDELFLACVRAGGARGMIETSFVDAGTAGWKAHCDQFTDAVMDVAQRLHREKMALTMAQERKVVRFDSVAHIDRPGSRLAISLRNFRIARVVEASDAGELVDEVSRPSTRLEDVIGARAAKEALQFVIDWMSNPKRYSALGVRPPKGILLGGPPGTGKTMLARAIAGESNCAFVQTSATTFVTIWQGSGPQNVRNLFERARRYAPAIVFIDEIDAIGMKRSGGAGASRTEEETLNALLTEMDGFGSPTAQPVIVLAATNLIDRLDDALKRRFDRVIEVDRPDKDARLKYLERVVLDRPTGGVSLAVVERIAGRSAGLTIADLERIVQEAAVMAAQQRSPLTDELLEESFEKFRMGESRTTPDEETLRRVSRHEAGHALIEWLAGNPPVQVTIVGRGHAGGYVERESDEEKMIYTKADLEWSICSSMGGRAAEIVYYGAEDGLSSGASGDLQNATRLAERMVTEFGMAEDFGHAALDRERPYDGALGIRVNRSVGRIVTSQLDRAVTLLQDNRGHLDTLSVRLFEKNRLTREELEQILPPLGSAKGAGSGT